MSDNFENFDDGALDDALTDVLRDAPVRPPRQLHGIRTRARAIRAHRQALTFGGVVAGVFVIAGAVATATVPFERIEFGPAKESESEFVVDCRGDDTERYEAANRELDDMSFTVRGAENVPDDVRWLWPEGAVPDPAAVWAQDESARIEAYNELYRDCAPVTGESVVLVSTTDDGKKIWKTIYLERVPESAIPTRTSGGVEDTLDVRDTTIAIHTVGELTKDNLWSRLTATWSDGENTWYVAAEPIAYNQLAELVETVSFADGKIDVSGWDIAKDSDYIDHGVSKSHSYHAGSARFEVESPRAWLTAHNEPRSMWLGVRAGSKPVEVNGRPAAILKRSGGIRWQTEDGITLELTGDGLSRQELIDLAESVQRVEADDPRLGDEVWTER